MQHQTWKRKRFWPRLRFVSGQSEVLLAVSEPLTFTLAQSGRRSYPATRHVANVILNRSLEAEPVALVWDMSDQLYRSITVDPTDWWIKVTRHGTGKQATRYEIEVLREATEAEKKIAAAKLQTNLETVVRETQSRCQLAEAHQSATRVA
jgi:hypothetical protein